MAGPDLRKENLMADETGIEWADSTMNFWEGCAPVGPGCLHCYAEIRNEKYANGANWGVGAPRRRMSAQVWNNPMRWDRDADLFFAEHGRPRRVFCGSLMDIFDNEVPLEMAREAYAEMEKRTRLNWQPLTKRVGNVERRVPDHWKASWPNHIGLMITVVNQDEADRDIRKLLDLKRRFSIPWIGLSMEPLLGLVNLRKLAHPTFGSSGFTYDALTGHSYDASGTLHVHGEFAMVDWVIVGGESGDDVGPMHPSWARFLIEQCEAAGTPVLFKQWGEFRPGSIRPDDRPGVVEVVMLDNGRSCANNQVGCLELDRELSGDFPRHQPTIMTKVGKSKAGREIDGRTWTQYPRALL
jgi:protein gp37